MFARFTSVFRSFYYNKFFVRGDRLLVIILNKKQMSPLPVSKTNFILYMLV